MYRTIAATLALTLATTTAVAQPRPQPKPRYAPAPAAVPRSGPTLKLGKCINLTLHRLPEILEGELDELVGALLAEDEAERLAALDG